MERKNDIIITLFLVFFLSGAAFASNKEKIYRAYISNRMDEWKTIIDSLEENMDAAAVSKKITMVNKEMMMWMKSMHISSDSLGAEETLRHYQEMIEVGSELNEEVDHLMEKGDSVLSASE